jgi:hypothetical protein
MLSCPVMDPGVVEAAVLLRVGMGSADTNPKARADDEWLRGSWELSSLSKKKNVDDDFR